MKSSYMSRELSKDLEVRLVSQRLSRDFNDCFIP